MADQRYKEPANNRVWIVPSVLILIAFGTAYLITHAQSNDWGPAQWGPLSGWFSGLLTAFAVSVALWQVVENRKVSEANRRSEQAKTITPIWVAVADLQQRYEEFNDFMKRSQGAIQQGHQHNILLAVEELKTRQLKWRDDVRAVELVFEPALLSITEPHTQAAVASAYSKFDRFTHQVWDDFHDVKNGRPYRPRKAEQLLRQVRLSRQTVFWTARVHLTRGPKLDLRDVAGLSPLKEPEDEDSATGPDE